MIIKVQHDISNAHILMYNIDKSIAISDKKSAFANSIQLLIGNRSIIYFKAKVGKNGLMLISEVKNQSW